MGIFSKYLRSKSNYNKLPNEAGKYIGYLKKIRTKKDEKTDSITFIFECRRLYEDNGSLTEELYDVIISFDFYNKNDNLCGYFVNAIQKILQVLDNDLDKVNNILDNVISLEDLKKQIEEKIDYKNIEVIIQLKEVELNNKIFIKPDYNEEFIKKNNNHNISSINSSNILDESLDDLPF